MDLGRIRSRLPAILGAGDATNEASTSSASAAAAAPAVAWSCCWRCSSCWASYRRALRAGRQQEDDSFASVLVQVLGVKETVDLQEGFGFFVQHVLSGGLEKAHGEEKRRGKGRAGGQDA
ncbi:unnamed protein product [Closterium sp. NIES-53]